MLRQHVLDLRRAVRAAGCDLNASATFFPLPVRLLRRPPGPLCRGLVPMQCFPLLCKSCRKAKRGLEHELLLPE